MPVDLQELLSLGEVETFNNQRPSGKVDLYAADLSGAQLTGVDLSGANLENADLSGAVLSDGTLARANLEGADCTGAKLDGVMAIKSKWRGAYLGKVDLSTAELTGAEMAEVELPDAKLDDASLAGAKLSGADLSRASLVRAMLGEARLNGTKLVGADLTEAVLEGASLLEADLSRAILRGADFSQARMASAILVGADLTGAILKAADLTGADLRGARLTGANLQRADLTDAKLDDVDLSQADLTDAQVDPAVAATLGLRPKSLPIGPGTLIEEPAFAISQDRVAVLWENEDEAGRSLRIMVGPLRGKPPEKAYALPVPMDLVLSRGLIPTDDGFLTMVLVERPAGTMVMLIPVAKDGSPGVARTMRLPFTPMVRPVLRLEEGEIRLYAISREGPGLHVLKVTDDGLVKIHLSGMSTARGFVSAQDPVVLSKGGVLVVLRKNGPDKPVSAPPGFPGRNPCATAVEGGVALAWANKGQPGMFFQIARPATPTEAVRLAPEDLAGTIDILPDGDAAWLAWTQESIKPGAPGSAWAARLPGGKPIALTAEGIEDCGEIRFCVGRMAKTDDPAVAVSTGDGGWAVFSLGKSGAKLRWSIPGPG